MNHTDMTRLLLLAAIWGASFLFMRIGAPVLGPVALIEFRVGLAALFLLLFAVAVQRKTTFSGYWRDYLVLGLLSAALPFLMFGYAAQMLTASLMSILNATVPIWSAIVGVIWLDQTLTSKQLAGLLLGMGGVMVLVGFDTVMVEPGAVAAVVAILGATLSYALSSNYAQGVNGIDSFEKAHGSMWAATLLLAPLLAIDPVRGEPTVEVTVAVLLLGVLCTGIAFLLFFRLIETVGATSTLTVTFLIPLFGVLWGHLFLDEQIGWHTLAGGLCVLFGTAWVTGFSTAQLRLNRR